MLLLTNRICFKFFKLESREVILRLFVRSHPNCFATNKRDLEDNFATYHTTYIHSNTMDRNPVGNFGKIRQNKS